MSSAWRLFELVVLLARRERSKEIEILVGTSCRS
jgi:hypothetical protein